MLKLTAKSDKILTVMDRLPLSPDLNITEAVRDHLDRDRNKEILNLKNLDLICQKMSEEKICRVQREVIFVC